MSRHRDVRCMNYSEEYEGYDDVYGHSVEDDYCVSPSAEQFLFDRSKQQNIASFITEPDIVEDNEDDEEPTTPSSECEKGLTELEKAKLMSCMESVKNIIGDTVPESDVKKKIIQSNFDAEVALDLILKESSPKNVKQPPALNKDNLEHNPDATIKPQSSSFVIPKFSFRKKEDNENFSVNTSLMRNLQSLKNLSISSHPMTLSSLSGFTSNSTESTSLSNTNESCECNSNTLSFSSLADLTAHHLQKSGSLINSTNSNGQTLSSSTNFVIPKFSIKKDTSNDLSSTHSELFNVQKNVNTESGSIGVKNRDYNMDSLEKNISSVFSLFGENTNYKNTVQNLERKENSTSNVSGTRTPSPDSWLIDLSSALKESTSLITNSQPKSKGFKKTSNDIHTSNLHTFNQNVEIMPYVMLPTTLDLSYLKNIKLPRAKESVSLFGRTLCRSWKSKKPTLKSQEEQHHTIKRFDFSTPYTRS